MSADDVRDRVGGPRVLTDLDDRLKRAYMTAMVRRCELDGIQSIHIELGSAAFEHLKSLTVIPDERFALPSGAIGALGGFPILEAPEQASDHIAVRMTELIF